MKKSAVNKMVCLALSGSLALSALTGCSGGNGGAASTAGTSAASAAGSGNKVETITVWTDEGGTKDIMNQLVDQFNSTTGKEKGIQIDYKVYGSDYYQMVDLAVTSGKEPELFKSQTQALNTYTEKDEVVALEDMPGGSEFLKRYEGMLKPMQCVFGGKTYAVPFQVNTIGLLYNKDLFKKAGIVDASGEAKAPVTWDEMRADAKKLTNPSQKVYGVALALKWDAYFDWEIRFPFFSTVGDDFFNNKNGKYDFSSYKPATDWLLQIKKDGSYFPGAEGLDNDSARAQFAEGRVGMKFGAVWDVGVLNDQFPAKMDWGVAAIPKAAVDSPNLQFALASTNLVIGATAKKKDLNKVMAAYEFLNSDEVLARLYQESKVIPYDTAIMKKATKKPDKKGWEMFSALLDKSKIVTLGPTVKIEGQDYHQVLNKIWAGEVTPDSGLADLDKRYNAALQSGVADGSIDLKVYQDTSFDPTKQ